MALPDLTGINIENSYQRVVHTDGVNFYNGTGSLLGIRAVNTGSFATTGSNTFSGSQIIDGNILLSGSRTIQTVTASLNTKGPTLTILGGHAGTSSGNGGDLILKGGNGINTAAVGGDVYIEGGDKTGSQRRGNIYIGTAGGAYQVYLQGNPIFNWDGPNASSAASFQRGGAARFTIYDDVNLNNNYFFRGGATTINAVWDNWKSVIVRGSGTTSATTSFLVQNSTPSTLFSILDNGNVGVGTATPSASLQIVNTTIASGSSNAGSILDLSQTWNTAGAPTAIKLNVTSTGFGGLPRLIDLQVGGASRFYSDVYGNITAAGTVNSSQNVSAYGYTTNAGVNFTQNYHQYVAAGSIQGSTGTSESTGFLFTRTINQTGAATGITRGLYIAPTLTSAVDFRAVENTVGNNLLNSTSGNTYVGLSTNTGTAKLQVRGAGATDSTNAFVVQNSAGNNALSIANGLTTIVHQDLQLNNTVLYWNAGSQIRNISNGVLRITNSSNSDFTRLQFGGGTTAFPSLQRSGASLCVVDSTGTFLSNLLVGTTTDSGFKLDVSGSVRITNNAIITGSLIVTETDGNPRLDTSNGVLYRLGTASVDWRTRTLNNTGGAVVVDWENNQTLDTVGTTSIDWEGRALYDPDGLLSVDYGTRRLRNSGNSITLNWETGDTSGTAATASFVNPLNQNVQITGSLLVKDILQLAVRTTTPTPVEGMIIASGSVGASKVYYYNGSTWNALF